VSDEVSRIVYLLATVCFILCLKKLSSPRTAPRGNAVGAFGMCLAVGAALLTPGLGNLGWILAAMAAGTVVGVVMAKRVRMTAMPQMVALLNGFGGLASGLVATGEALEPAAVDATTVQAIVTCLGVLVGGVTFTGSVVAFAKLQGLMSSAPVTFPFQKTASLGLLLGSLLLTGIYAAAPGAEGWVLVIFALSLPLGVLAVNAIGGADMPVVIALLNSYSGIAGSAAGYVIANDVLVVAGALVGASGIILTVIMCKAMNRSLANVLFGGFGTGESGAAAAAPKRTVRNYGPADAAILLTSGRSVVVVPGYGMAVAQAQHAVRELCDELGKRGVDVKFGIHPVAGRMPGHMNVLLAEANVEYGRLLDMDQANPVLENADVALVIGANDVVNPIARTDKSSPIYGMPILDVDKARGVIILKRSLASGFAGIDNPLFYDEKTMMLFGDAKKTVTELVAEVKNA
jgi:NAD(P) transhydrogenase subunit beta